MAVVGWTEPHRYALADPAAGGGRRGAGGAAAGPAPGPAALHRSGPCSLALLEGAGFRDVSVQAHEAVLEAPDAAALAGQLGFAPGMETMLQDFGADRVSILAAFTNRLISEFGAGPVRLPAVAHVAVGTRP